MPEGELLNRLRPYSARLSGSSDGRRCAEARAAYLAMQTARKFAPLALDCIDLEAAGRLRAVQKPEQAMAELSRLVQADWPDNIREAVGAAYRAVLRTLDSLDPIYTAELSAVCAVRAAAVEERAWDMAIETLEQILKIGRRADPIEVGVIEERAAKVLAFV